MHLTRNQAYLHGYRGFKSLSLRQNDLPFVIGLVMALLFCSVGALAQAVEKEPVAIFELGADAGWSLESGSSSIGPTAAVEVTPIENWLELEAGVTPTFAHHATEWDADLLFKKPWTLSQRAEFMFGVGPEWIHLRQNRTTTKSLAGEVAGDFMFWPAHKHRFGWYLEPAYEYNFGRGHEQSLGVSGGLLIAVP